MSKHYLVNEETKSIFNGVIPRYEKHIISAGISSNYTVPADGARQISLDTVHCQVGDISKLTLKNGAITIGKGVNHVMVSASAQASGTGSLRNLFLKRNDDDLIYIMDNQTVPNTTTCIPAQLVEVKEGDIISFRINFTKNLLLVNGTRTNLTVEVID